ncbi:hypothetical protein [uncultured Propionibacterium sp.]|uniref:hypothetical protein n=1 Tax=uncultured Propionibacterium sp. TaxID=218066 RepID=UPI00292FE31A|nr:hypothetical protein [uncultured Propionibacterium sp.]
MSRRRLLKTVGVGGGAVLAVGAAGTGIRGVTNGAWDSGQGEPYELWRSWQDAPRGPVLAAVSPRSSERREIGAQPVGF